jgi:hypothetical protein
VGQGFGGDPQLVGVTINHAPCNVTAVNDTHVWCTAGESPGGTYEVRVHHKVKGRARSDVEFTYELLISAVQPDEGERVKGQRNLKKMAWKKALRKWVNLHLHFGHLADAFIQSNLLSTFVIRK